MIYGSLKPRPRATTLEVREAVESFEKKGRSGRHEQASALLHHILNHCINRGIGFELTFKPGAGYFVKKVAA
jgi:hypothetical protein